MKRIYLFVLMCSLLNIVEMHAYDFSAPDANGNTIYYSIVSDSISVLSRGKVENEYHYFKIEGNCVSVVPSGTNYSGNLAIPSQIVDPNSNIDYKVVSIADSAFRSCSNLLSISLPSGLKLIGTYAFESCTSLSTIDIPDSVLFIGHDAFVYCSSLASIHLPENLPSIENGLFNRCYKLTEISLPFSVQKIKGHAFYSCTGLSSFYAHKNIMCIDYNAFEECSNLKKVFFTNVDSIGSCAFLGCNNLNLVYMSAKTPSSLGGYAFNYGRDTLYVLSESLAAYQISPWAEYFNHIIGMNFGESSVDSITSTTATLKWLPDTTVIQYDINVYTADTLFAHYIVDGNGQVVNPQNFAPSIYRLKMDTTVNSTDFFVISLSGLTTETNYTYTIDGINAQRAPVYHEEGTFTTLSGSEVGFIDAIADEKRNPALKFIKDSQIFILRGDKIYTVTGQEIQ